MSRAGAGCPVCPHSNTGYHVAHNPGSVPHHPKPTDTDVYCAWCRRWCTRDGVRASVVTS